MFTIYKREMQSHIKTLLIWVICVGGMGFACIFMFSSMEEEMAKMAESYASMGAFADAFGMSKISMATITGFFATEIGAIHGLGGAMFAAIISMVMLSKEEDGHTSEFLYTFPVSREKIISAKLLSVISLITVFSVACAILYMIGFAVIGNRVDTKDFLCFHGFQLLMDIEIALICFMISAFMKKNKLGLGLGIVLLLYAFDMIARAVPKLADSKLLSPFSYANAAEIFSGSTVYRKGLAVGVIVMVISTVVAYMVYGRRDLAS